MRSAGSRRGPGTSWRSAAARRTPSSASAWTRCCPREITLIHGPGCPVCVTPIEIIDKAVAIAVAAGGDLLLVRRHAPRARLAEGPVHGQVGRGRRADRLLADGRRGAGPQASRAAGRVLRRRLRDHRAGQRDGGRCRRRDWAWRTSRCWCRTCWCRRRSARCSTRPRNVVQGFLAAGHVCTVMGIEEYRPIAAQYRVPIVVTGFEPLDILQGVCMCVQATGGGPGGGREPVRPHRPARGQSARRIDQIDEVFQTVPRKWRGIGEIPASGWALRADVSPIRRRPAVRGRRHRRPTSRPSALPARCCRATRSRTTARPSASAARPTVRWAPRWFPPKGPARRTTAIGGTGVEARTMTNQPSIRWPCPVPRR